jgi:hypothetical protein
VLEHRVGGDRIQRKIYISAVMFSLVLFMIIATSSAATVVNQSNTVVKNISSTNSSTNIVVKTNIKAVGSTVQGTGSSTIKINTTTQLAGGLTLLQMLDGLSRAQTFYNTNHRLPNYVSYGTTKIVIADFQKIIATQGLKINLDGTIVGRPIYITSDNIRNTTADNARINNIIAGLKSLGLNAYNMGLGPNSHVKVLQSTIVPNNALVIDIYGGADAGTLYEMGTSWYKSIKGTRNVFTVFWPPSAVITGLAYLKRSADDNYDVASFKGLANPDQYLLNNGYQYLYSGDITTIINALFYQATH